MTLSVVIAAGGTGGHLVPALAIASALRRRAPDVAVAFVGTARGLERDLVPRAGYDIETTAMRPFGGGWRGAAGVASTIPATVQARAILKRRRARCVVGMGGYASLPVIAAARLSRVPSLIHEANVVAGLANEVASRLTRNIAVSFPPTLRRFPGARLTGIPLRDAFTGFDRDALRPEAFARFGFDPARRTVLVFGGSLGATSLNDAAVRLAQRWADRLDIQMLIVAGGDHAEQVRARVPSGTLRVAVEPFVDRMELAFAVADVALCRAGASTVAELAVAGLPAVLVPLPIARRREQHANAAVLADAKAAVMMENEQLQGDALSGVVEDLLADESRRRAMSDAARSVARPGAADEIAAWIEELAR